MEYLDGEEGVEPASPSAQYMNSKALSLSIIAVLETKVAFEIDETELVSTIKDVFLPINRRFSSIMVTEENGEKKWKPVVVNAIDHLKFPTYPIGKPLEYYDECLTEYLTNIAMEPFPQSRPPWEIHIFRAHHMVKRQKSSASVYLNGQLLEFLRKFRGPEAAAGYIHGMMRNTSITMTNMIGPLEEASVINHPIKGIYFFVAGSPQGIII
ncbi:unnamed protein product [Cuscuta epithymum]|uniref:O-acyltransferase WSD1 C-terminal domain-containing protein n=1 Tax=Cuscuta epithymum TaxID=186058 RepID=A0AAV0DKE8_9ASTE|nr:unnamed protein product [Cuscuta epithymum]